MSKLNLLIYGVLSLFKRIFSIIIIIIQLAISCGCLLILIFLLIASPFIISWAVGTVDTINCQRLEATHIICQYEVWRLYGLWYKSKEFKLHNVKLIDDSNSDGCSYKITLLTDKGEVGWHQYNCDYLLFIPQKAKADLAQFHNLLNGSYQPLLQIKRGNSLLLNVFLIAISLVFFIPMILGIYLINLCYVKTIDKA